MEMQAQIVTPEIQQEISTAVTLYDKVQVVSVITTDDYVFAGSLLKEVKSRLKKIEETEEGMIKPLRDGYNNGRQKILDFFSPVKQKLENAKNSLGKTMLKWAEDQEARRREEERRLQEEARKRAEEEALRQAIEAEAIGEKEEAEQIMAEPVYVPPIRVASEIPKSKESHIRETWSAEIFDVMALVKGIAEGKVDIQAIEPNNLIKTHSFLNTLATRYKETLNIPGVRAISKKTQI